MLQIFAAWPAPSCAGVDDRLRHRLKEGLGALELLVGAADHQRKRARGRRRNAARNGSIDEIEPFRLHRFADIARTLNVDGRAIDQQRARLRVGRDIILEHSADVLRGGEHGDDDVGVLDGISGGGGGRATCRDSLLDSFGNQVERADIMPRLGEVRRHSAAHVAQANKCDPCHV